MSVIISDNTNPNYDGNLSTANSFYRVEAHNLGSDATTALSLSSARTISVTFSNAGNCQGVVLSIHSTSATMDRSIIVKLQEYTTSWVDRASSTLTYDQILGTFTGTENVRESYYYGQAYVPFVFSTPYAVDTSAGKWRISVQQTGGSTGTWYGLTSDRTNLFYATWCDNQLSHTNDDTLIVKDSITIDKSFSIAGVLGTGTTDYGICGVICRNEDYSKENVALLKWQNPAVASYTFTVKGYLMFGCHSGFRVGTESNPIAYAQMADIYFAQPNVGTVTFSGFRSPLGANSGSGLAESRSSLFIYGEVPNLIKTTLASDALISQAHIITTDDTSSDWNAGDYVIIGKQNVSGQGSTTAHQISSISGNDITLTANLSSADRLAGGSVVNFSRFGVRMRGYSNTYFGSISLYNPSNYILSGIELVDCRARPIAPSYYYLMDDLQYRSQYLIQDCVARFTGTTLAHLTSSVFIPKAGMLINRLYTFRGSIMSACTGYTNASLKSGYLEVKNCICFSNHTASNNINPGTSTKINIHDNRFENSGRSGMAISGLNTICEDNYFWGCASPATSNYYTLLVNQLVNPVSVARNTFNLCGTAIGFGAYPTIKAVDEDSVFGDESANTYDIAFYSGALIDYELSNPTGIANIYEDLLPDTVVGSRFRITTYNGTAKDDRNWLTNGKIVRCGDSLSDTTVRTSGTGKYSLRFEPGADVLEWEQLVPTGNIQNKTMIVTVWVKINSANYYSATHTNPTLCVNYDNGTESCAVAVDSTDWQQLAVVFTPTTEYGKIEIKVGGYTDQVNSDAYFYVDDMNIAYPAGYALDLGGLDIWASGLPITPAIATFPSFGAVWDEPVDAHNTVGTYGNRFKKLLRKGDFLALK